jgi:hypothetical protein
MREEIRDFLGDGHWHDMLSDAVLDRLNLGETAKMCWALAWMEGDGEVEMQEDGDRLWVRIAKARGE